MISKVIADLRVYQQKQYALMPVNEIRDFLAAAIQGEQMEERELYDLSLKCEPRESKARS